MDKDARERLNSLLTGWYEHALSEAEERELLQLIRQADDTELTGPLRELWEQLEAASFYTAAEKSALVQKILPARKRRMLIPWRIAAAAVLLLLTGLGLYRILTPGKTQPSSSMAVVEETTPTDISAPQLNRATLTLSDGRTLVIDTARTGMLATEGAVSIEKSAAGELVYSGAGDAVQYHTLTVPRGSKPFRLTLPDGSTVQVNVASSITYPTAFAHGGREVTMTGEAYFDIEPVLNEQNIRKSFTVKVNGMEVRVTGTRFNINAYNDEASVKTTLLEGGVNIVTGKQHLVLAPNQQAIVVMGGDGHIQLVRHADVEEAMAWLNGKFSFTEAGVEEVMRQVSRWYDVEVNYLAKPSLRFGGRIDRNSTLRQMLTILETSGLNFSIRDNTVTILP